MFKTLCEIFAEQVVPVHALVLAPWAEAAQVMIRYSTILPKETRACITDVGNLTGDMRRVDQSERSNRMLFDDYHKCNVTAAYTELEWE